jgi:hypothetical protein
VLSHEPSKGASQNHEIGRIARPVNDLLELSVVGSFSRVGYRVHTYLEGCSDSSRLDGKTMVLTGASSGVEQSVAVQLAAFGGGERLAGWKEPRSVALRVQGSRKRRRWRSDS